jgi:heme-degrading monooxygenase HmoA
MFSVIFEVLPRPDRKDEYLELAKHLKPLLEKIDGFVDNERFESKRRHGWVLSHSTWRDEKSVIRWRTQGEHHKVQEKGRTEIFDDYHLRVGDVTHDTHPPAAAPIREQRWDATEVGAAQLATLTEIVPGERATFGSQPDLLPAHLGLEVDPARIVDFDVFESIYNPGKLALLIAWRDVDAGVAFEPRAFANVDTMRHRKIRIVRDYGRFDRREAPQFYPPVQSPH